jgi:uncharacterized phiE125 gp8 family phage protein
MANYRQVTQPATEPLTYAQAKAYLRLNGDSEQSLVTSLIVAARQEIETQIWRPLISQTWAYQLDYNEIDMLIKLINKAPLISVDTVTYYDANNAQKTLSSTDYEYDIYSAPPRFRLKTIPTCYDRMNTLQVNFTCGYSSASTVPQPIIDVMYRLIGDLYEVRQSIITGTQVNVITDDIKKALNPYRNNFIWAPLNG